MEIAIRIGGGQLPTRLGNCPADERRRERQAGGAEQGLLDQLAIAFVLSRVLYFLCYLADWGPIRHNGKLQDRAAYRYYWTLLKRARTTGVPLPDGVAERFFTA